MGEGIGPASLEMPVVSMWTSVQVKREVLAPILSLALRQKCSANRWVVLAQKLSLCLLCFSSVSSSAGLQTAPEGSFASADALLSRLAHPASLCGALDYLEPDLAEKNPPVFAQKLQVCSPCVTLGEFVKNLSRE